MMRHAHSVGGATCVVHAHCVPHCYVCGQAMIMSHTHCVGGRYVCGPQTVEDIGNWGQ